jgi:hypothetical protein
MTLLARGHFKTALAGTRSPPVAASHVRADIRVPVRSHDQGAGSGQNGALSSKKTTTGITAQPTMS